MRIARRVMFLMGMLAVLLSDGLATAAPACPEGTLVIGADATFPPFSSKVGEDFVGFEIDMGEAIGRTLGCRVRWVNSSFDGIFPALLSNKFDLVIASVTITDERRRSMLFSDPYMDAGQSIAIRSTGPRLAAIGDLKGKRVGVGLNTTGQYVLEAAGGIDIVKYPTVDLALADLRNGRLDAAVGDRPVFRHMIRESFPGLQLMPVPLNKEQWAIVLAPGDEKLLAQVNQALATLKADGTMAKLEAKHLGTLEEGGPASAGADGNATNVSGPDAGGATGAGSGPAASPITAEAARFRPDRFISSIPIFITGAKWTLVLSVSAFLAALPLGLLVAIARLSRFRLLRMPASAYVEVLRGTPLLVQIFFIYFVMPAFGLSLSDLATGILALSINASAYISEIFRAGLLSIDAGQGEAAAALGLTRTQALRHVLVPQAVRRVVPPLTNEGIALLKESSLVSIMGMTELTRTGQELASRYADPLTIWPGVALTYFVMTFPLTVLSNRLEQRLNAGRRRDQA